MDEKGQQNRRFDFETLAHHHLSHLMYASRHYTVGHIFLYFTSFIQAQYSLCFILSQRAWMDGTSGHLITAVQCKTWSLVAQTLLEIKVLSTICLDNPVWFLVQPSWSSITITRYIAITNLYFLYIYILFLRLPKIKPVELATWLTRNKPAVQENIQLVKFTYFPI